MGAIDNLATRLRHIAAGAVRQDSVAGGADLLTKLAQAELDGHRKTGTAQDLAHAVASVDTITLRYPSYVRWIKGTTFGRGLPKAWVDKVRRLHGRRIRDVLKGA